jgi:aquaporin Z
MKNPAVRKAVAEFVGSFTLIFIGAGSVIAAVALFPGRAIGLGLVTIAFATGLAIATMVSAVGHISGGHFNPAVTIGAWITRKIETTDAIIYIVAQAATALARRRSRNAECGARTRGRQGCPY